MPHQDVVELSRQAESLYDQRYRQQLEASHPNEFVAIEPQSGDYFLGRTLSEAIQRARRRYPDRRPHALRIGHAAAVHFGAQVQ
jgi:hypothetical protein